MKRTLLSILRDKNCSIEAFRQATEQLGYLLAFEAAKILEKGERSIETPLAITKGEFLKHSIVLIPILRAGLALLPPFLKLFSTSRVGFAGMRRDEVTALPHLYYHNIPAITTKDRVIILDPMIATGGSGLLLLDLISRDVPEEHIIYVGIVAAPEGMEALKSKYPKMQMIIIEVDEKLNSTKFIVPGLGDFGDRYFGT